MKDVTKPVVLDAVLNKQGVHPMTKLQTIGFNATTSFNRSAFGVGGYVPNVGDKITVNITTEASVPAPKSKSDNSKSTQLRFLLRLFVAGFLNNASIPNWLPVRARAHMLMIRP